MTRPRTTALASAVTLAAALALGGCSSSDDADAKPKIEVTGAFMPQPVNTEMAGAFMTVTNDGGVGTKLTGVTSDLSDDVQIHEAKNQTMRQVQSFDLPAHGALNLERGGSHIMFMGLKHQPEPGEKVTVQLRFQDSDPVTVEVPVKERTYNPKHH
ncbi:copper chaperone PCu(A)C [Streptomyces sp. NPDC059176]|uniref:copper chaperone PCu(A)C n=1 Tax=unclassified Streptomyces TaxID=2593676 RepID=UPI0036AE1A3F